MTKLAGNRSTSRAAPELRAIARKARTWEPGREWQTVNAIDSKSSLTMAEKSLLIRIAKHEARHNGFCHASTDTLAFELGCDPRTITSTVKILEKRFLVAVIRTPGRSSSMRIDWKNFARLPSTTPLKNEGGAKMSAGPPAFSTVPPYENGGRGVKNLEGEEKRGPAPGRPSQDTEREPSAITGKAERTYPMEWQKLSKKTAPTSIGRPKDPLVAEFWDAIFVKRLENIFYQTQQLGFGHQLIACVEEATTDVFHLRAGKRIEAQVSAEDIKKLALEKLNGAKTIELVPNFGDRATQCCIAVRNATSSAAAALYHKKFPPARAIEPKPEHRRASA